MRKIMIIAAFLIGLSVTAQAATTQTTSLGSGAVKQKVGNRDTIANAATDTTYFTITGDRPDFTIEADVYANTGTIVGSVRYYYTINGGLTWYLAETDTLTNATNSYTYEKNYLPADKWMVIVQTTGTSNCSNEIWVRSNK